METTKFYDILLNKHNMSKEESIEFINKFENLYNNDEQFENFLIDNDLFSYYSSIINYIEKQQLKIN